jgi:hypothetical protein
MNSTPVSCSEDMCFRSQAIGLFSCFISRKDSIWDSIFIHCLSRLASVITCNLTDDIAIYTHMNHRVFVMLDGLQTYTEHMRTHGDFDGESRSFSSFWVRTSHRSPCLLPQFLTHLPLVSRDNKAMHCTNNLSFRRVR